MEGIWIAAIVGSLVSGVIFGLITKHVAGSKGYDGGFAWGFWLGWIGLIVVAVRPTIQTMTEYRSTCSDTDGGSSRVRGAATSYSVSASPSRGMWECSCGSKNPATVDYCLSCRRQKGEALAKPKVKCPHCGANNSADNENCFACMKPMKEKPEESISKETAKVDAVSDQVNLVEMIEQLAQLRDKGILSEEEFQGKKKDILTKM